MLPCLTKTKHMKNTVLLLLAFVALNLQAQVTVPATYATDFKTILESAKKSYKGDQSGTAKVLAEAEFDQEYTSKNKFKDFMVSRLVTDKDGVLTHHAQFKAGIVKDAAVALLGQFAAETRLLLPPKYKESESVLMNYFNNRAYVYQLDSDNFSEVSQKPVITMGLIQKEGVFYVDIRISAPAGF